MRRLRRCAVALACAMAAGGLRAAEEPKLPKISGLLFGDAYWFASDHDPEVEGQNGFWIRRIYLTFDQKISDEFDARLRFEMNQPGDFTSSKMEPFVKDAWLRWTHGRQRVVLGISPTPTWEMLEEVWGYRSVEKTPLDLQKMGSSRDFGLAVQGTLGAEGRFGYHVMLANGSGEASETNEGKKLLAALQVYPAEAWLFEIYADVENRPGQTDRTTYQLFGAYRAEDFRWGVHLARQKRETGPGTELDLDLLSIFATWRLAAKAVLLGRLDRLFDANPDGDTIAYLPQAPDAEPTLLILGIDYQPHPKVSFIPNVEVVSYDAVGGGPDPDTDIVPRVTFFFRF